MPATISATPKRVFEGYPVGAGGKGHCTRCKTTVREGDPVGVYAYRTSDADCWDVARLFCSDCCPLTIDHPTLGATELVLSCRLAVTADCATQTSRLTLREIDVDVHCPPETGSQP